MNKEFNGFDEMVEALEENEDMVECKECFDLFPKAECERAEVGYVCPVCKGLRTAPAQTRFVDPYDCYTQEFPEVKDYNPDSVVEYEKEPDLGDALDDLIKDEYEAIDGYEVADEKIQHADIDADQKDEILDTLDHIKEEEEEHIDELKELCPECDEKEENSEELTEDMKSKIIKYLSTISAKNVQKISGTKCGGCDTELSAPDANGISKCPTCSNSYANKQLLCCKNCGGDVDVERDFKCLSCGSTASGNKSYNQCKTCGGDLDSSGKCNFCSGSGLRDLDKKTADKKDMNTATKQKAEALVEAEEEPIENEAEPIENEEVSDLDSAYEAALEIANESGVGQVFGYAKKDTEEFVAVEPFEVDDPEAVEDDLMAVYDDVAYAYVAYPAKSLEESLFEDVQLTEAPGIKSLFSKENRNLDSVFGSYIVSLIDGGQTKSWEVQGFRKAEKLAAATSKNYSSGVVYIYGGKVPAENYEQLSGEIAKLCSSDRITNIATYRRGKATLSIADKLNQAIKNAKHFLKAETKFGNKIPSEEEKQQLAELEAQLNANLENATDGKVDAEDQKVIAAAAKEETSEENTSEETSETESEETAETTNDASSEETSTEDEESGDSGDSKEEQSEELPEGDNSPIAAQTFETADKIFNSTYTVAIVSEGKAAKRDGMIGLKTAINQAINDSERDAKAKVYVIGAAVKPEEYEDIDGVALGNKLKELKLWKRKAPIFAKKTPSAAVNACYTENGPVLLTVYQNGQRILEKKEDNLTLLQMNIKAINKIIAMGKAEDGLEDDNAQAKSDASKDSTEASKDSAETAGVDKEKAESNLKKIFKSIKTIFGQKSSDLSKVLTDDMILQIFTSATGTTPTTKKDVIIQRVRQGLKGVQTSAFESDMFAETLCETLNVIKDEVMTESDELLDTGDALQNAAKSIGRMTSGAKAVVGTMKNNLHEEYHRYANPAELAAMKDIEELITKALTKVYANITAWGYEAEEVDSQSFLCQEDETCLQYMVNFQDLDPDEYEDLADQLQMQLENEISIYKPVPEIRGISVSVALPDYDLADEDDDAEGITKASFLFYVDFARNLF